MEWEYEDDSTDKGKPSASSTPPPSATSSASPPNVLAGQGNQGVLEAPTSSASSPASEAEASPSTAALTSFPTAPASSEAFSSSSPASTVVDASSSQSVTELGPSDTSPLRGDLRLSTDSAPSHKLAASSPFVSTATDRISALPTYSESSAQAVTSGASASDVNDIGPSKTDGAHSAAHTMPGASQPGP